VAPRGAFAAALRVRARGEEEVAGEAARRSAAALGRVAVEGERVPAALRIEAPADVRDPIGWSPRRLAFGELVAHELPDAASIETMWPSRISSWTGSTM
jgi:hypothetical protein